MRSIGRRWISAAHGLADYGEMRNLLEVVSTWVHEVAGINAGNVYGMRFVASLFERRGDAAQAAQLRAEAKDLAARINRLLYVEGKGWWKCGQPDGTYQEVRHCYDLLAVFDAMFEDLSDQQKKEMSNFFWTELLHAALDARAFAQRCRFDVGRAAPTTVGWAPTLHGHR